jgi:hypothetical protein
MGKKKKWGELTDAQKIAVVLLGTLQIVLLVAALWDIRQRPADEIRGSKRIWTLAAFINFIGPIAYFLFGRER